MTIVISMRAHGLLAKKSIDTYLLQASCRSHILQPSLLSQHVSQLAQIGYNEYISDIVALQTLELHHCPIATRLKYIQKIGL